MCKDSLEEVQSPLTGYLERLSVLSSNALALANRIPEFSGNGGSRRHASEEHFPAWVSEKHRLLLAGKNIKATAVVAADGSGDFSSINDALAGIASKVGGSVIFLKAGVYKEKLRITKDDVTLIGEGKYSTIITQDSSVGGGTNMPETATVGRSYAEFINQPAIY